MATDNTQLNGNTSVGDLISTDAITTLNGGAIVTGEKAQRVKVGWGPDGSFNDADVTQPLPVQIGDGTQAVGVVVGATAAANGLRVGATPLASTSVGIAAAGTGTLGPIVVGDAGNITFVAKNTTAASAWAGAPVLVFEQSDDGTSWSPLQVVRSDTGAINTTFTLAANAANTEIMFDAALEGVAQVRCRCTTGPTTNGMTLVAYPGSFPFTPYTGTIDRKDAGRTPFIWYAEAVAGAAAEALVSMTPATIPGTAGTAATTYVVPAGKTLRITSISISLVATVTTANTSKIRIRAAVGTPTVTSPIFWSCPRIGWPSATFIANETSTIIIPLADGVEFAAGTGIGLTHIEAAANGTIDVMVTGFLY